MTKRGNVLVIGEDPCTCLTIVRSLGRYGLRVVLATQHGDALPVYSRYTAETVLLPPASAGLEPWWEAVEGILCKSDFDLVVPASDGGLVPLAFRREEFARLAKLAIPDEFGFAHTYRKDKTFAMAAELGVPLPPTTVVREASELRALAVSNIQFPVFVKSVASKIWHEGRRYDPTVRRAQTAAELLEYATPLLDLGGAIVQGPFRGYGVGQEFLVENGRILTALQHERVHEPIGGGGSYYRKTVPLNPVMLEQSRRMLEYMRWTGVAMVEYKQDRATGQWALMEINGRFWGSLPVAAAAGMDFPGDLYRLLVEGRRPERNTYRTNVYSRNVTPDLFWFSANWRADRSNPYLVTIPRGRAALEWLNVLTGREHWDTVAADDLRPGLVEAVRLTRRVTAKVREKALAGISALWLRSGPAQSRLRRRLRRALEHRPHLLFVCYGNICRSPFAALYARHAASAAALPLEIESTGTHPKTGRPSPPDAVEAAAEAGIDLSVHRSQLADETWIKSAGAIVCMDRANVAAIRHTWPEVADRIFLLGDFIADGNREIPDPWGESPFHFQRCYSRIQTAVDKLIACVSELPGMGRMPEASALAFPRR